MKKPARLASWRPVVIIGAPRSGTNMLRDVLTALPGVATWPCDEINYIWRYGNARAPSDRLSPDLATPVVRSYIRRQFAKMAARYEAGVIVEKTCANSLRVPFVERVLPEPRYVYIWRDGFDAVASAVKRWRAKAPWPYLLRKARFVPVSSLPYYGSRFLRNRLYRVVSGGRRLAYWGPRFDGMGRLLHTRTLEEVCAEQWRQCVASASRDLGGLPQGRVVRVEYEVFVKQPIREVTRVAGSLGIEASEAALRESVSGVTTASVGKGRRELGEDRLRRIAPFIEGAASREDADPASGPGAQV